MYAIISVTKRALIMTRRADGKTATNRLPRITQNLLYHLPLVYIQSLCPTKVSPSFFARRPFGLVELLSCVPSCVAWAGPNHAPAIPFSRHPLNQKKQRKRKRKKRKKGWDDISIN
ncbi:hypothetical protein V8C40DRAFT_58552 [Trichoderma camerunense]